ncbi:MAG: Ribulosamine/erythrulosamine 3-kinase [Rhodospirillaceae bacterium]|nr:MAG: Ribulosamine/erythrulosamine 3-kinase [Rhodospirillaceae bacterium]
MGPDIIARIESLTGTRVVNRTALSGGCVAEVYRATLADGASLVAKIGRSQSGLAIEGFMLTYLRTKSRLPVPDVLWADDRLLLMTHVEAGDGLTAEAQIHAAVLLAELHGIRAETYGFECDTLIGGLHQPNPPTRRWIDFFRDQRLLYMGGEALRSGRLPSALHGRLETFAARLETWLEEPTAPSLIHGDMWSGNVLCRNGRIAAFIDPALSYADAEIELAFATLFGTFGEAFFRRYQEICPLRAGFFEERRDIYNLYPLLVHVRLFGGGYVGSVERILRRFGG